MLIRRTEAIKPSEITDSDLFLRRREFLRGAGWAVAGAALAPTLACGTETEAPPPAPVAGADANPFRTDEDPTAFEDATRYNNFYEFGTDKGDPRRHAGSLRTRPWSVAITGEVGKPGTIDLDDLLRPHASEERVYRLRCVEAWSMVIPGWAFPSARSSSASSRPRAPNSSPSRRCWIRSRCRANAVGCWIGPMSKGCGSTRRCIR